MSHVWKSLEHCSVYCVLQCVAVCCSVLQCVAVCCSVWHMDESCMKESKALLIQWPHFMTHSFMNESYPTYGKVMARIHIWLSHVTCMKSHWYIYIYQYVMSHTRMSQVATWVWGLESLNAHVHMCDITHSWVRSPVGYGLAFVSRIDEMIGLCCKRIL